MAADSFRHFVADERIAELLELPDGCNALFVDMLIVILRRVGTLTRYRLFPACGQLVLGARRLDFCSDQQTGSEYLTRHKAVASARSLH